MRKGLVHVYTGDGKGKTTAAVGLAVRAAGCGMKALVVQFCKTTQSGELVSLGKLGIPVERMEGDFHFSFNMSAEERGAFAAALRALWVKACDAVMSGQYDMVVLDEAIGAYHASAVAPEELADLAANKPEGVELVFTGRAAPSALVEAADYVSAIDACKHPYSLGVPGRRGVEF